MLALYESASLRERWQQLRQEDPRLRIRNAAQRLGVSELALLRTEPERARRLCPDFPALYRTLREVGPIMTLARNDEVVHETTGALQNFHHDPASGVALSTGAIDLRLFFGRWRHVYAVDEDGRRSLQCFDAAGQALHKIYAVDGTDTAAWDGLVADFGDDGAGQEALSAPEPPLVRRPCRDAAELRRDWAAITDLHQFHDLLRRHDVDRLSALEAAGSEWARPLPEDTLERILQAVAGATPIMAFAFNPGTVQIYTGVVRRLVRIGPWYNVLDPDFNLHVRVNDLAQCWLVRRPSADGDVHALDFFNRDGALVLSLFGARKPGVPEREDWRGHLAGLEKACAA